VLLQQLRRSSSSSVAAAAAAGDGSGPATMSGRGGFSFEIVPARSLEA